MTIGVGAKFTLFDWGRLKLRLYGGVSGELDYAVRSDAPSGFGGYSVGGGLLLEANPFAKH